MKSKRLISFLIICFCSIIKVNLLFGQNPLDPLGFLIGGTWVVEYELPDGTTIHQERNYQWSFDKQLIIGKTFRVAKESKKQTRLVIFSWNSDKQIIEFWDFIDSGGYGKGIVNVKNDTLYMEADIIGSNHVNWKANFINKNGKEFVSEVQVEDDEEWKDAGTFVFRKK